MIKKILITVFVLFVMTSCAYNVEYTNKEFDISYRDEMRNWVMKLSDIAKEENSAFLIIPQNCSPLLTETGYADDVLNIEFIESIDGMGQEGISYGNDRYNVARDSQSRTQLTDLLNLGVENGLSVLSVNYCDSQTKTKDAVDYDDNNGFISFVASSFDLTDIQNDTILNVNSKDILSLADAKNWLFLLNPEKYNEKHEYIDVLCSTNYDVLVIDAFFYDDIMLSGEDVEKLKTKDNGAKRLVISYLSIGEAENYRYYWNDGYQNNPPKWILDENPNWAGNYPVEYWNYEWQEIIAIGKNSYLRRIINAGFDGAYLDIVDGYQTFEDMNNK